MIFEDVPKYESVYSVTSDFQASKLVLDLRASGHTSLR